MFCRKNTILPVLLIISLLLILPELNAQVNQLGVPKITNFESRDYGYESQNFDIEQSDGGLMYFSNVNGILEYDNSAWRLIRMNGTPHMDIDCSKRIFVAGHNQIGYLKSTLQGTEFVPLKDEKFGKTPQVNDVVALCGEVFFASDTCIYKYANEKLTIFKTHEDELEIYEVGGQMLVWIAGKGLFRYVDQQLQHIPEADDFKDYGFRGISIFDSRIIVKPERTRGLHVLDKGKLSKFDTQINEMIEEGNVTGLQNFRNKYLLISTEVNGLFVLNKKGQLMFHLNKASGLSDNHVTKMFVDRDKQLWVSTYNGLSYVELSSPFTYYNFDERLNVSILAINKRKDKLYFSTNQGVYWANTGLVKDTIPVRYDSNNRIFTKIDGLNVRVKNLVSFEEHLYACTDYGIYLIRDNNAEFLIEGNVEAIVKSTFYQDQYYIACSQGVKLANIKPDGRIELIGRIRNLNYDIRTIAESENGHLWLGTDNDGVFKIEFTKSRQLKPVVIHIQRGYGMPENYDWVDVYKTRSGILFSTFQGVYRMDEQEGFVLDDELGLDFQDNNRWVYPIYEDKHGDLWLSSGRKDSYKKKTGVAEYHPENQTYSFNEYPFQLISDNTIECIFVEEDNTWLGSINGIIRYNQSVHPEKNPVHTCAIRHFSVDLDTVLLDNAMLTSGVEQVSKPELNHRQKNLRFEYTAPFYQAGGDVVYQTRLLGLQDGWTEYSQENFKEYTNLGTGEYVFQVRAKNPYGEVSDLCSFGFSIRPPLYFTWWAFVIYVLLIATFTYMLTKRKEYQHATEKYRLEKIIASRTEELLKQKEQTERLVNRILPKSTVKEITEKGKATSKRYEMATVLFADIQNFTRIAEETRPEILIKMLDKIFQSFDQIIEKFDIEKIKTIGDAYMCAGGIPNENSTNPIEVVLSALEMQRVVKQISREDNASFEVRIGIHTGPVIAGVVGTQKIAYDIWGDTVNIASRLETYGEISKVNISATTYSHVKDFFQCLYRGKNPVKQKGEMDMYFVEGILPELAKDKARYMPNHDFIVKTQMVRLQDLQNDMFEKLEKNLPKNLYYHNLKHTVNVYYQTEMIARSEGVSEEEMLLLKTAALMHDAGYLVSYDHHEEKGMELTQKTLPTYHYSKDQIDKICELIIATKMPQKPKNLLEEIICDADLDYLGRPDFIPTSQNLFRELFERNKIGTIEQWNKMQMKFMEKHRYFTATARRVREPEKQKRLAELKQML